MEVLERKLMYILYKTQLLLQLEDYPSKETGTLDESITKSITYNTNMVEHI